MVEKTKEQRIKKEYNRLRRIFKEVAEDKLKTAEGIMRRAAFMRVVLEDLEADINENGTTELFSQTEGIYYQRERPAARVYNTTFRNYQTAIKQLLDLLPNDRTPQPSEADELMQFIKGARK